jgi:hypothetical protein
MLVMYPDFISSYVQSIRRTVKRELFEPLIIDEIANIMLEYFTIFTSYQDFEDYRYREHEMNNKPLEIYYIEDNVWNIYEIPEDTVYDRYCELLNYR